MTSHEPDPVKKAVDAAKQRLEVESVPEAEAIPSLLRALVAVDGDSRLGQEERKLFVLELDDVARRYELLRP